MTSMYKRNVRVIDGFREDLEISCGGWGGNIHYLDPITDEEDRKWMLGLPTTQFSGGMRLYSHIDRVDGLRTLLPRTPVIYKDVLEQWLESLKE